MELTKVSERVFYITNVTNIGVIKGQTGVVLIDSGLDDDTAKRIIGCLSKEGLNINAVISTHSHADHIGGNYYIKEKTGAKIYSPRIEDGILANPYFEPLFMFSGADPINDLKNKLLMAKPAAVDYIIEEGQTGLSIDGIEMEVVRLPGHSLNQIGIVIDDILFCADSVVSEGVLRKHKIPFCINIEGQLEALYWLKNSRYELYIPSHSQPVDDINKTVDAYLDLISHIEKMSLELLYTRKTSEQYLKEIASCYGIHFRSIQQYYLMNTIAHAYLSYLYNKESIKFVLEDNTLYWLRV